MRSPRGARTALISLLASSAVTFSLVTAPQAAAAHRSFSDDPTTRGGLDIDRVQVTNERRLTVRVTVDDLQARAGQGEASAWLDTDPRRAGPEFFVGSGLYESDWQIGRVRNWRVVGNGPLNCPIEQRLSSRRETIEWVTGRACLGSYSRVRVSASTRSTGVGVVDHSPARHRLHGWVARY